jgi:hypothetical protein
VVGKWRGTVEAGQAAKSLPVNGANEHADEMARSLTSQIDPQLSLRPDKTFTLSISIAPIDGTWKLDQNEIILTPKSFMGRSVGDVKQMAEKELKHVKKSDSPFPIPSMDGLPMLTEMKASYDQKAGTLTLDPGSGTILANLGKIVFKKA